MFPGYEPFVLAVIFVVFGFLAKILGKREPPKIEDFGLSTTISLMTLGKIWTDVYSSMVASSAISEPMFFEAIIGCGAPFMFAAAHRFCSWRVMPDGTSKKRLWWGVIIPDVLAILILLTYFRLRSVNSNF
jgi:hypothetical protein